MTRGRQRLLSWLRVVAVAFALSLLAWTFRDVDFARVQRLLVGVSGPALAWVLVPMGCALCLESFGWAWAFRSFGQPVPFLGLFRVRVTSEALALTLPLGMLFCESTKPFLLARHCRLQAETSVAGMAARKYLLLASQAAYILLFALLGASYLEGASVQVLGTAGLSSWVLGSGVLVGVSALGCALALQRGRVAERVLGALSCLPLHGLQAMLKRSRVRFTDTDGELRLFFRGSLLRASLPAVVFFCGWLLESVETYLILRLFGIELPFVAVASFEVALSFLRHVTFVLPGGIGVQDLGYVVFLRALGVSDPLSVGAGFVLLKRAKECAWALLGYALLADDLRSTKASTPRAGPFASALESGSP